MTKNKISEKLILSLGVVFVLGCGCDAKANDFDKFFNNNNQYKNEYSDNRYDEKHEDYNRCLENNYKEYLIDEQNRIDGFFIENDYDPRKDCYDYHRPVRPYPHRPDIKIFRDKHGNTVIIIQEKQDKKPSVKDDSYRRHPDFRDRQRD